MYIHITESDNDGQTESKVWHIIMIKMYIHVSWLSQYIQHSTNNKPEEVEMMQNAAYGPLHLR